MQRCAQAPSCKLQSCPTNEQPHPLPPPCPLLPAAAEVEAEARRRQQREASEVNRLQAQRRAAVEAAQRAAEQDALRRTMAAEVGAGWSDGRSWCVCNALPLPVVNATRQSPYHIFQAAPFALSIHPGHVFQPGRSERALDPARAPHQAAGRGAGAGGRAVVGVWCTSALLSNRESK